MPELLTLNYAEFYITNACNFNCSGCNRFNNYNFAGTQMWADYAGVYEKWSQLLDIKRWSIMGGEPMMNPSYLDWLQNLHRLWPNAKGSLLTNGHFLRADNRSLYHAIQRSQGRIVLDISLHNVNRREQVLNTVKAWLQGEIVTERIPKDLRQIAGFDQNWYRSYSAIRDTSWPDCDTVDDWNLLPAQVQQECQEVHGLSPELLAETRKGWRLTDTNGVTVKINHEDFFHQDVLKSTDRHRFVLHNSDPVKAHANCSMQTCHHFIHGKLYKCGVVGLLPELDQQFNLDITSQDRDLINSYRAADPDMPRSDLQSFIDNLNQPIAQCKFCTETYDIKQIFAEHGNKIKVVKKNKEKHETQITI